MAERQGVLFFLMIGSKNSWIPVVKEVVAHLGIAQTWSNGSDKADR